MSIIKYVREIIVCVCEYDVVCEKMVVFVIYYDGECQKV